jgi:hypothetical protein
MRRIGGFPWACLALALTVRSGVAVAEQVDLAGRVVFVRHGRIARFVAEPAVSGATFDLPDADPTAVGGRISFIERDDPDGNDAAYDLPVQPSPFGWKSLGERGYRYRGSGSADDPCTTVLLRRKVLKAICRGTGVTLANPVAGALAIVLTIGADVDRYCADFGGTEVRNDEVLRRRNAPPPPACTCGAVTPKTLSFASGAPSGVCGGMSTTASGPIDLQCGVLYFGGGEVGTPPFGVTDMQDPTTLSVDCCFGNTLILGPSPEASVGAKRCSREGCLFGPPLVVPNTSSTPQSVCVYPTYTQDARGTARCDTGEVRATLPIAGVAFLTGDALPRRCSGGSSPGLRCGGILDPMAPNPLCPGGGVCLDDPALQPCPVCNPTTLVCNGGQDNGMACVPGSDEVTGPAFPTSRDCTVSNAVKVGEIPLPLSLTSGTSTRTAVTSGTQENVFCGYCRDAAAIVFEEVSPGIGRRCSSDADCEAPYGKCEQRSSGGLGYGDATEITEFGVPAGNLADHAFHDARLVGAFCLPPTFIPLIDAPSDLPGPGAVSFPGRLQLGSPGGAFTDAVSPAAGRW